MGCKWPQTGCQNRAKTLYIMSKQKVNIEQLVDDATNKRAEKKSAAKELRAERKAKFHRLHRGASTNRSYTTTIPGAVLTIRWINGCQQVGVEYTGKQIKDTEVEEVAVSLPSKKMTWKNLRSEVVAGSSVYNKSGKSIPCTKRAELMPDKEVKVTIENVGKTKIYRLI